MADPPSASATRPHRRSKTIERAIGSRSPFKPRSTPWTQADPSLRGRAEPGKPRYCRSPSTLALGIGRLAQVRPRATVA